jgi:hypothetical protein
VRLRLKIRLSICTGRFDSIAAAAFRISSWSMAFSSPWFCFSLTWIGTLASTFGL